MWSMRDLYRSGDSGSDIVGSVSRVGVRGCNDPSGLAGRRGALEELLASMDDPQKDIRGDDR